MTKKVVDEFMDSYKKEFYFYSNLAQNVNLSLTALLKDYAIRAIVTSRAKSVDSLYEKLIKRDVEKKYLSKSDIYQDMVDLSGVRVALYFPGDIEKASTIIKDEYKLLKEKKFPDKNKNDVNRSIYEKKFNGYHATHFRVSLKDEEFKDIPIEIQVASVLMHAWSEVEHDLIYKPRAGNMPKEELMILDEINGMVLSGNIALERLQQSINERATSKGFVYENHYDLASAISKIIGKDEVIRSKAIFEIFDKLDYLTQEKVEEIINKAKDLIANRVTKSDSFENGVILAAILKSTCILDPDLVLEALCGSLKLADNLKIKEALLSEALKQKDKICENAFLIMNRIKTPGKNFQSLSTYNIEMFDGRLKPKKDVSLDDAKKAVDEMAKSLNELSDQNFNKNNIDKIIDNAKGVSLTTQINKL